MSEHIKVDFLKSAHVGLVGALLPRCLVASEIKYCLRHLSELPRFINNSQYIFRFTMGAYPGVQCDQNG
jgi:hypothetical protein